MSTIHTPCVSLWCVVLLLLYVFMCVRQNHKNSIFCLSKLIKSKWVGFSYSPNDGKFFLIMSCVIYNQFLHSLFIALCFFFFLFLLYVFMFLYALTSWHELNWFYLMRHDKIPLFIAFFSSSFSQNACGKILLLFFCYQHQQLTSLP